MANTEPTGFDYADADAAVRDMADGTRYAARAHSHDEVMTHADHVWEMVNAGPCQAVCCHTCRVLVAY